MGFFFQPYIGEPFLMMGKKPSARPLPVVGQFQRRVERSFTRGGAMDEPLQSAREDWTGVVRTLSASDVLCMAHRQSAVVQGHQFEPDHLVAIYDVRKTYQADTETWYLQWKPSTVAVYIPAEPEQIPCGIEEVCAGMGGIAQGLEAIGFPNPLMCETLRRNGTPGPSCT